MNKIIGFIGCGNMAQAMIGGIVSSGVVPSQNIIASGIHEKNLNLVMNKYGIETTRDNLNIANKADIIILAVKPHIYPMVIEEIKDHVKADAVIITIAAGISLSYMEKAFGKMIKVVRTMPNTPALVREGMSAICSNKKVTTEELNEVVSIFSSFGKAELIEERLMDAIPAISGSSPAYVYMFIEALADGGVLRGIPRDKAYKIAAQAVLGAAKMVLETGIHPGALKDNVCSPGGTTIEAVYTLERNNFRGTVISAMESCTEKTIAMTKDSEK